MITYSFPEDKSSSRSSQVQHVKEKRQSCLRCVAQHLVSPTYLFAFDGHVSTSGQQQICDLEVTTVGSNVQKSAILQQTVIYLQQHIRLEGRTSGILLCLLTYSDEAVTQNLATHANTAFLVAASG